MASMIIGSCGVGLLLLAFVLNMTRRLTENSPAYLLMNLLGAGMAAWYAFAGGVIPFVILEIVWGGAALVRLVQALRRRAV